MAIDVMELIKSGKLTDATPPLEIAYLLTEDDCKLSFARGVTWAMHLLHADAEEILDWAERAELGVIEDETGKRVGFADRCGPPSVNLSDMG